MNKKTDDKNARLAEALRENLKKRKQQRTGTRDKPSDRLGDERQFRSKPIKPSRASD